MRISMNHHYERRIGIWPAGWDEDGDLFCNQRYGDWPIKVEQAKLDPWAKPEWMLLSYGKSAKASSHVEDKFPANVTDENVRTWWRAASNHSGEWIEVDLGREYDVRAVQINFADDGLFLPLPEGAKLRGVLHQERWIDETPQPTRWILEGSTDGHQYFVIEDKSEADTDFPHDLVVREEGFKTRYIKLTVISLPYGQAACVSGLRVFGLGGGNAPDKATDVTVKRIGDLNHGCKLERVWHRLRGRVGICAAQALPQLSSIRRERQNRRTCERSGCLCQGRQFQRQRHHGR
jgi:hypothetical protein